MQRPETTSQKLVLAALADRCDDDGVCWPSLSWLSRKCAPMASRSVRRALAELADQGLVTKVQRQRRKDGTLGVWLYKLDLTSGHQWPVAATDQWPPMVEPVATSGRAKPSIELNLRAVGFKVGAQPSDAIAIRQTINDALGGP